jgi:phospholipid transport system substrate-binding protein
VAKEGATYKITDVTVDNLSMAITKRDEFASVIQQNGGDIQPLIAQLAQKAQDN